MDIYYQSASWMWGISLIVATIAIHAMGVVLMALVGAILLLPGICGVIMVGLDPRRLIDRDMQGVVLGLIALGGGGIALIWSAVRRPR